MWFGVYIVHCALPGGYNVLYAYRMGIVLCMCVHCTCTFTECEFCERKKRYTYTTLGKVFEGDVIERTLQPESCKAALGILPVCVCARECNWSCWWVSEQMPDIKAECVLPYHAKAIMLQTMYTQFNVCFFTSLCSLCFIQFCSVQHFLLFVVVFFYFVVCTMFYLFLLQYYNNRARTTATHTQTVNIVKCTSMNSDSLFD